MLLTTVADLLDDDLVNSSAGLLRGGAIAWVEVAMPDTIATPEGVAFRPNLLATTSFDGSIATTDKRTVPITVCDNIREFWLHVHSLVARWEQAWAGALAAVRPGVRAAVVDLAVPTGPVRVLAPLARVACALGGSDRAGARLHRRELGAPVGRTRAGPGG